MSLPDFSLGRPVTAVMILVSMIVIGLTALFKLPLGFMPQSESANLWISVEAPGALPSQLEKDILMPLEEELGALPGLKTMWTEAMMDSGWISLRMGPGMDPSEVKLEARERVDRVKPKLPPIVQNIYVGGGGWDDSGAIIDGRISSGRDLAESYDLIDRRIKRPLERLRGVAQVQLYGVDKSEVGIDLELDALRRHNINIGQLITALNSLSVSMSLGEIEQGDQRFSARITGGVNELRSVALLPISSTGLRLGDIAQVTYRRPDLEQIRHLNHKRAIALTIIKEPAVNAVETVDRVMEAIEKMRSDPSLSGIDLLVWHNQAEEIRKSITGLRDAGIFGGLLSLIVLLIFLRRVGLAVIVETAIPFSLIAACGALYLMGRELNVLSMLGLILGVGMLVDNAVVVAENIARHQAEGYDPATAARLGANQVALAVLGATVTSIVIWLPFLLGDQSEMNLYISEIAMASCLTLAASLIISQTFIPLAAARMLKRKPVQPGRVLRWLLPRYQRVLAWTLRHRLATLMAVLALTSAATYPLWKINKQPDFVFKEVFAEVMIDFTDDQPLEIRERVITDLEHLIAARQSEFGYKDIYSFVSERYCLIRLYFPVDSEHGDPVLHANGILREMLPQVAGAQLNVGDARRQGGWGQRGRGYEEVWLRGESSDYLLERSRDIAQDLAKLPGVIEARVGMESGTRELQVQLLPEFAARFGLRALDIANIVGFTFQGRRLRQLRTDAGEIDMRLELRPEDRRSIDRLRSLEIPLPNGAAVPLESVAQLTIVDAPGVIQRENRRSAVPILVAVKPETAAEVKQQLIEAMGKVDLPQGYDWDFGSRRRRDQDDWAVLGTNFLLAVILIYMLMASLFESLVQPLAILISLPLAAIGASWLLWLLGEEIDITAVTGSFWLLGIVVNNGIVLIDHVNGYRRQGLERREALLRGSVERLRPILMTAITTIFGLVPMVVSRPSVAMVSIHPIAIVIMGGLITSTGLTLLALPMWYSLIEDAVALAVRIIRLSAPQPAPAPPRDGLSAVDH